MTISFEGQVAVVTGGGGGIGRVQSLELARRGAAVVVNDVGGVGHPNGPSADDVVAEIKAAGGRAVASYDTVATPEGGEAIIQCALDNFGTIDAVLHYAATWRHVLFDDMTPEQIEPVIAVSLLGGFYVSRPAWKIMKKKGYASDRLDACTAPTMEPPRTASSVSHGVWVSKAASTASSPIRSSPSHLPRKSTSARCRRPE
jgi:NAD(P)-dependent dehydrogenase (short-subunit alcohol dehydrogenase family)